ncbi:uncharacterized protein LOC128878007 isoform X1 [Hylaeus volcanicus]|uniref:uncharacterized protein LOC128878007 isoform X1 n=1 Tax=Hylaeus volcanicus TaxID=313075 RepID=UPI0023B7CB25|nr:uncharacterized protein LOC128878007 isoform X1 [Hylaeus volcanicus]
MAELETYYKLSSYLLSMLGLWPYHSVKLRRFQTGLISVSAWYTMFALLMVFKTAKLTMSLLLKNLSPIIMYTGSLLKYNAFWYQADTIKEFMDRVRCDWDTNHDEIHKILVKHACIGKQYSTLYAMFVYPSAIVVSIFYIASFIVITDVPLNETRKDYFPIEMEYLIDEEKYFYLLAFHKNLSLFYCASVFIATETVYIMWLQHAAGLFEITSYYIEEAVSVGCEWPSVSQDYLDRNSTRCLVSAVVAHKKATKFALDLKVKFEASYLILLILGVLSLSVNFYRLSQAIFLTHDFEELVMSLLFSISELVYMFYINYLVQQLLDVANNLSIIIYNTNWYKLSVAIQKLLLIIMVRCSEPFIFSISCFYFASIEGFSTLIRNTVSYFMMMSSFEV